MTIFLTILLLALSALSFAQTQTAPRVKASSTNDRRMEQPSLEVSQYMREVSLLYVEALDEADKGWMIALKAHDEKQRTDVEDHLATTKTMLEKRINIALSDKTQKASFADKRLFEMLKLLGMATVDDKAIFYLSVLNSLNGRATDYSRDGYIEVQTVCRMQVDKSIETGKLFELTKERLKGMNTFGCSNGDFAAVIQSHGQNKETVAGSQN
jgi:hypothetical protein